MVAANLGSLTNLFKTKAPPLIGVDISSTAVKLVELSQASSGAYRLERYTIELLPDVGRRQYC
jgi:type IV pilus assembly protein PilM